MKQWHLLGNGQSNRYYTPQQGLRIGFNIPSYSHPVDRIAIIDTAAVRSYHKHQLTPRATVLTTEQCVATANKLNIQGTFENVLKTTQRRTNSAHCVLNYLLSQTTPDQIHLWGFDSMYCEDLTSQMDRYFPRHQRPPLNNAWHPYWLKFFKLHPTIEWVLHLPKGETASVTAQNFATCEH